MFGNKSLELFAALLLIISIFPLSVFADGPKAYLNETVTAQYNKDGLVGIINRNGTVQVLVPNAVDVLQYLRINLSDVNDETDLNVNTTYRSVAASVGGALTYIYINSSDGDDTDDDLNYGITNTTAAPALELNVTYSNDAGGEDYYSSDTVGTSHWNNFSIQVNVTNPSDDVNLDNDMVYVWISFLRGGQRDRGSILTGFRSFGTGTSESSLTRTDTDSDNDYDQLLWIGSINSGSELAIEFNLNVSEGIHDLSATSDNWNGLDAGDSEGARSTWNITTGVLTANTLGDLFSRGPVLQGIDFSLASSNYWQVRGFIENAADEGQGANGLVYNVSNWTVYEVDPATGGPFTDYNLTYTGDLPWSGTLSPTDNRAYTDWFNTTSENSKPYFSVAFDWDVSWDGSNSKNYYGEINTTLVFPTVYEVDITPLKSSDGIILPEDEQNLTITDRVTHAGDANAPVEFIEFLSYIPNETGGGTSRVMDVLDYTVNLSYNNGTTWYLSVTNESEAINISVYQPSATGPGLVNVTIWNISKVNLTSGSPDIDDYLRAGEWLELSFIVTTNDTTVAGENFTFYGTSNFTTFSGTPLQENFNNETITASEKRLVAFKQIWAADPSDPSLINVTINISTFDKSLGGLGITDIKWVDYIPAGTDFDLDNLTVRYYNESDTTWYLWTNNDTFNITNQSLITLSDGLQAYAMEYEDNASEATWWGTLYDLDKVWVSYQIRISEGGDYVLPTQIAGFDPDTGQEFGATTVGYIKVMLAPEKSPLVITESGLELSKFITVGKPAEWIKIFEVYNPNLGPVTSMFEAAVFRDTVNAYVTYTNDLGEEVKEPVDFLEGKLIWQSTIKAQESRVYTVKILTPPVIETDRQVDVLNKISDTLIRLKVTVSLRNLAEEYYRNVRFNLPIKSSQVFEVLDELGQGLEFLGEGLTVLIPNFPGNALKEVSVDFRETYPLIIIKTDKNSYDTNDKIVMTITVINGAEDVEKPFVETEVYSEGMDLVYSNILDLSKLEAAETTEVDDEFRVSSFMPTGAYVANAKFRGGVGNTFVSGNTGFTVAGLEPVIPRNVTLIMILLLGGMLVFYVVRRSKVR